VDHSLQLAVLGALEEVEPVSEIISNVREVVNHFNKSDLKKRALKQKCKELNMKSKTLQHDSKTRWTSAFGMLFSFYYHKTPLLMLRNAEKSEYDKEMEAYEERHRKYNQKGGRARLNAQGNPVKAPVQPSASPLVRFVPSAESEEWDLMKQVIDILQLPAELSVTAEGEYYPTLSLSTCLLLSLRQRLGVPQPDR